MANANVGRNDDASALYSNPAAITLLPGLQAKVGITLIQPGIDVSTGNQYSQGKYSMNTYTQVVPNLYATYRIDDNMSVGLGVYTPFGLKSDFQSDPNAWAGAFNNYYTSIATTQITPTFAYRIVHDQPWAKSLSVGVGIGLMYTKIDIRRQIDFTYQALAMQGLPPDQIVATLNNPNSLTQVLGQLQAMGLVGPGCLLPRPYAPVIMKGSGWDANYNLSLQWEINDQIAIGLVYRSVTREAFHGASAQIEGLGSGRASAGITLPASWNLGINYSPIVPLNLGLNFTYTQWSSWNALNITTSGFPTIPTPAGPLDLFNGLQSQTKNWGNVWRYSVGGEYQVNNQIAVRAGFTIDKDPVNKQWADFMVPSNDRMIGTIGLGWTINKNVGIDFAYGYLHIKGRTIAARPSEGIYAKSTVHNGHANIVSVSGNFRF